MLELMFLPVSWMVPPWLRHRNNKCWFICHTCWRPSTRLESFWWTGFNHDCVSKIISSLFMTIYTLFPSPHLFNTCTTSIFTSRTIHTHTHRGMFSSVNVPLRQSVHSAAILVTPLSMCLLGIQVITAIYLNPERAKSPKLCVKIKF